MGTLILYGKMRLFNVAHHSNEVIVEMFWPFEKKVIRLYYFLTLKYDFIKTKMTTNIVIHLLFQMSEYGSYTKNNQHNTI